MPQMKNPCSAGTRTGILEGDLADVRVDPDYAFSSLKRKAPRAARYWLHVRNDGVALRFKSEPADIRSLCVDVIEKGIEQTFTRDVPIVWDRFACRMVPPRGYGWTLHENSTEGYTVWRREPSSIDNTDRNDTASRAGGAR
jgi:hypothetical protein